MMPRLAAFARQALPVLAGACLVLAWLRPVARAAPPLPLPAEMEPTLAADLELLLRAVPDGEVVGIAWRPGASSWHWSMAAYHEPRLRFDIVRGDEAFAGGLMLVERELMLEPPWRREACGERWCSWRR